MGRVARLRQRPFQVHQPHRLKTLLRAQRIQIKMFDRFDGVAEKIDADGEADLIAGFFLLTRQINIDDPAANREISGHFHLIKPVIAMLRKPDDQLLRLQRLAGANRPEQLIQLIQRGHRLHERLNGGDDQRVQGSGCRVQCRIS